MPSPALGNGHGLFGRLPVEKSVSIIAVVYNMDREAPRTLWSLTPRYQRELTERYEVLVLDNGSHTPFELERAGIFEDHFRVLRFAPGRPSPAFAINAGIEAARGDLIGVMIDGARIVSPGMLKLAAAATRIDKRVIILTLAFHLGHDVQTRSIRAGYDQAKEDRLLAESGWEYDGYRLFDISVFAGSSCGGWFAPLAESNAVFMPKCLWKELGGFDEAFVLPGGGLANLDLLRRAVGLRDVTIVTLLGGGTFHQMHGGVATNATHDPWPEFHAEYQALQHQDYERPTYQTLYFGSVVPLNLNWAHTGPVHEPVWGDGLR